jgi:hypothetical protein
MEGEIQMTGAAFLSGALTTMMVYEALRHRDVTLPFFQKVGRALIDGVRRLFGRKAA